MRGTEGLTPGIPRTKTSTAYPWGQNTRWNRLAWPDAGTFPVDPPLVDGCTGMPRGATGAGAGGSAVNDFEVGEDVVSLVAKANQSTGKDYGLMYLP